jgi:hypothetical protein
MGCKCLEDEFKVGFKLSLGNGDSDEVFGGYFAEGSGL